MKNYISLLLRNSNNKLIVDTKFVLVIQTKENYRVFLAMSDGDFAEHNPFALDLQGLVAAMQLSTECCAGKFYLKTATPPQKRLEQL
mgnify:CR=1 FL=1